MRIDLTQLLEGKCREMNVEYSYMPDDSGVLLPNEITLTAPVQVQCRVTDQHGCLTLTASASASYNTVCDRCLDPISASVTFSIKRLIGTSSSGSNAECEEDCEDDWIPLNGGSVEIDGEITEALALELPLYHLCRPDCPGLCPTCGKRLADGDCGCASKKEIDPRLAILQKLLEKPE